MEVVLLWLDEIEDWIFVSVSIWARRRLSWLRLGLISALLLPLTHAVPGALVLAAALWTIAAVSLGFWSVGVLVQLRDRSARSAGAFA